MGFKLLKLIFLSLITVIVILLFNPSKANALGVTEQDLGTGAASVGASTLVSYGTSQFTSKRSQEERDRLLEIKNQTFERQTELLMGQIRCIEFYLAKTGTGFTPYDTSRKKN